MFKTRLLIFAALMLDLVAVPLFSQSATAPSVGNGSSSNPYQISTLGNLYWLAQDKERQKFHYVQIADINAAETKNWFGGKGWVPIGYFQGSYNGKGHIIDSLFSNRPDSSCVGFFGVCTSPTIIDSLGLCNVNFKGGSAVGGLAGEAGGGTISHSYSTGNVTGINSVGGLVGSGGIISNCYSTVMVTGTNSNIGGLVGASGGRISNSYSTGVVTGVYSKGGLVGSTSTNVKSSFWDTQSSGQTTSGGGTGKTTAQMKMKSTYTDSGWNFVGETSNGVVSKIISG